jgi:hypothetical protein
VSSETTRSSVCWQRLFALCCADFEETTEGANGKGKIAARKEVRAQQEEGMSGLCAEKHTKQNKSASVAARNRCTPEGSDRDPAEMASTGALLRNVVK